VLGYASIGTAQAQSRLKLSHGRARKGKTSVKPAASQSPLPEGEIIGQRIIFLDGSAIKVDEVWKQDRDFWYRAAGVAQRIERPIRVIDPIRAEAPKESNQNLEPIDLEPAKPATSESFLIVLKGGARVQVDEITETDDGAWYRRGNLSIFLERDRIARIERESTGSKRGGWNERGWTSGNARIDELIRLNGERFGVDPYLVFCVIEHESHFNTRAVSPKGARGLMQLMPSTASRFGVRRSFDPAENIFGGTQYLKELLQMFGGRLDLALAGYNAGEGKVLKYGRNVPPYQETREYVRRITRRYGVATRNTGEKSASPQ
jgi:hypothetical protein